MEYKSLICGLGNPGDQYANTRHNFGFMLVDHIVALGETRKSMRLARMEESGDYELWRASFGGATCLFCKPMTYMNLSGGAVSKICGRHGLKPQQVIVAHDELDLSVGRMKFKRGGGNNGHRGLESITECLNANDYFRLRLGIGRPQDEYKGISDWVLEPFARNEEEVLPEIIKAAAKGLDMFLRRGVGVAQQFINSFLPERDRQENAQEPGVDS
ncbi:aminoacyl-tRNA hydrolase [Salidesulfovibrio onnuriiensis]|uniref:aminoacyl-tRNA hydrolase n=1 Tax=Salidesulfovibrio onnuriiensis TaxID=2583823 RepID=UPI0011C91A83|nr:aminoacyl-tRNA hydrolase [Salidesulfovibrio onnuriiensis]